MELRLTDQEYKLLLEILAESHKHLLFEIARAHHYEFKVGLRHRCVMLEEIMLRLKELEPQAA